MMNEIFNCGPIKCMKTGEVCLEIDRVRVVYSMSVSPSTVAEITLKGVNYSSICRILYDARMGKVVDVSCSGFKQERVKATLEECFREKGVLYAR